MILNRIRIGVLLLVASITMADVRYVWKDNPTTPVPPYTSGWAGAATNIQDAIDVCAAGDVVLVTNGVYDVGERVATSQTVPNRLVIDKAVRVESVNGPELTSIVGRWNSESVPLGAAAIRGVYIGGEAVLCGFTVANGATEKSESGSNGRGGGLFLAAGGLATNCVITGCCAWSGGGAASALGAAGSLKGCTLTDNQALFATYTSAQGGGASLIDLVNCMVSSNSAYYGGGVYDGTLEACEIVANTAGYQGGGGLSWNAQPLSHTE